MSDFEPETPSGSFSPVGESSVSVFNGGNLKSVIDQLVQRFSAALKLDRDEVENAKAAANGPLCSDGYDADTTAANFLQAEQDLCKNLDTLVGSEAMSGMSTGFPAGFSPSGGAGRVGMWLSTADAPTNNQNPYDGWEKVRADLDGVIEDSRTTGTSSWQSEAGDAYRQDADSRITEAVSLQSLATNSRDALEALVQVQTTIVEAIVEEFNKKLQACAGDATITRPAKTTAEFKNSVNQIVSETVGDSMWSDFQFYTRSCAVDAHVRELIDFMNTVNDNGHEWVATSRRIGVTLQEAVEAARRQQTHDSSYDGGTTVDEGPDGYESTRPETEDSWA